MLRVCVTQARPDGLVGTQVGRHQRRSARRATRDEEEEEQEEEEGENEEDEEDEEDEDEGDDEEDEEDEDEDEDSLLASMVRRCVCCSPAASSRQVMRAVPHRGPSVCC